MISKLTKSILKDSVYAGILLSIAGFSSVGLIAPFNGIVFSFGLFLIISLQLSLFTGNILRAENGISKNFIKLCIISYIGNFIGCAIFAYLMQLSMDTSRFTEMAQYKASLSFSTALIKGIFCNLLVCMAAFLARVSKDPLSKFICITIPVTLFILCGFEHSIANMSFFLMTGSNLFNLLPVTIGNIIGGLIMVNIIDKFKGLNND